MSFYKLTINISVSWSFASTSDNVVVHSRAFLYIITWVLKVPPFSSLLESHLPLVIVYMWIIVPFSVWQRRMKCFISQVVTFLVIFSPSCSTEVSQRNWDGPSQKEVVGLRKRSVEARSASELRKCHGIYQVIRSHSARQSAWTESGRQLYSGMFPSCHN